MPVTRLTCTKVMPNIKKDLNGIVKLLRILDAAETIRPDKCYPAFFHECQEAVAPYLIIIFSEYFTGVIPTYSKIANAITVLNMGLSLRLKISTLCH